MKHAKEEGINFLTLHNPIEYIADEKGAVKAAVLQVMELGEPDASGRRSPVPVEGKTVTLDVDQVIVAVGVSPNPLVPKSIEGLELGRKTLSSLTTRCRARVRKSSQVATSFVAELPLSLLWATAEELLRLWMRNSGDKTMNG